MNAICILKFILYATALVCSPTGLFGKNTKLHISEYLKDSSGVVGTYPRTESETKFAFEISNNFEPETIIQSINQTIAVMIQNEIFEFPRFLGSNYSKQKKFQSFVFVDLYLDTEDKLLQRLGIGYRIRNRFRSPLHQRLHKLFPFVKAYQPIRSEIQFKTNNQIGNFDYLSKVTETRFELRQESEPFLSGEPLPAISLEKLTNWATSGKFRRYRITPMSELAGEISRLVPERESLSFTKQLQVVSKRFRNHFSVKHPWGSGPNPEQVFIITIDIVSAGDDQTQPKFMEVEIEFERNTSFTLERINRTKNNQIGSKNVIAEESLRLAKTANEKLIHDHLLLQEACFFILKRFYGRKPLPISSKYNRFAPFL